MTGGSTQPTCAPLRLCTILRSDQGGRGFLSPIIRNDRLSIPFFCDAMRAEATAFSSDRKKALRNDELHGVPEDRRVKPSYVVKGEGL